MFNNRVTEANIFNIGSGIPVSFEQIADELINKIGYGKKIYIDKPNNLTNNYQEYTCANIEKLRKYGYKQNIPSIIEYIKNYE
jgi:ADP-L-glycero-D-manno-heptose 6-epimerase